MESSRWNGECCSGFGFGFNDVNFSDRTIQLHIIPDPVHQQTLPSPDSPRNNKRLRTDDDQHSNVYEADQSNENPSSSSTMTKTIHITSLILAAKSPFFYKLFSNGMAESNQRHVTLQIQESEEKAFMDLLMFMYTNTLTSSTPSALRDVLMVADKYEVASCMKYCFQLLQKLPMTRELALLYLDLPSTILMANTVQSLTDAAKEFLVAHFKDINKKDIKKFWEEMYTLPLVGIEAVLSSDDLQVTSEDSIYEFVMKWARTRYKTTDERQAILTTNLLHLIRFPFMSFRKLEKVLTCTDINIELSSKLVFHALAFKIPHLQLPCEPQERVYKLRPLKVIRFNSPHEECVVYLDLKHEECARLLPSGIILSQTFDLRGQEFYLVGRRETYEKSSVHSFGFYLGTRGSGSLHVEFEFSSRRKPSEEFVHKSKLDYNFDKATRYGIPDLFGVPWDTFMAEDSPYFINGVLRLKAVIKIKN